MPYSVPNKRICMKIISGLRKMDPILIVIMWCSQHPSLVLLQQQKSHSPSMHPATHRRSWRTLRITMNWRNPTASYSVLTMH